MILSTGAPGNLYALMGIILVMILELRLGILVLLVLVLLGLFRLYFWK